MYPLLGEQKGNIGYIEDNENSTFPSVQRTFLPGEHNNEKEQACKYGDAYVDIIGGLKGQRADGRAQSKYEKNVEDVRAKDISHGDITVFLYGGDSRSR